MIFAAARSTTTGWDPFLRGGLVVETPFPVDPEVPGALRGQIAIRTLIQPDGDVLAQVCEAVLTMPPRLLDDVLEEHAATIRRARIGGARFFRWGLWALRMASPYWKHASVGVGVAVGGTSLYATIDIVLVAGLSLLPGACIMAARYGATYALRRVVARSRDLLPA